MDTVIVATPAYTKLFRTFTQMLCSVKDADIWFDLAATISAVWPVISIIEHQSKVNPLVPMAMTAYDWDTLSYHMPRMLSGSAGFVSFYGLSCELTKLDPATTTDDEVKTFIKKGMTSINDNTRLNALRLYSLLTNGSNH